ncbi:MAG TPA: DMT family transporter [Chloroflexota bacterium]
MGELLAIGSALAWALTSVAMRPMAGRALWRSSVLRMVMCTGLLGAYAWPGGAIERVMAAPAQAWLGLLGSTLCSMVVGDSLYFLAASRIGVAKALPIASSFPLLTTIGAVFLLDEVPTPPLIVGSAMVVTAVALIGGERARSSGRSDVIGLLLAGLAAGMWAGSGLFLRPALRLLDPIAGNMIRFSVATVLFTAYVGIARPVERMSPGLLWLSVSAAAPLWASPRVFSARSC